MTLIDLSFGDPWEEFNRIVWSAQVSTPFASGMIDGYFDNEVPDLFWKLLALYITTNIVGGSSIGLFLMEMKKYQ